MSGRDSLPGHTDLICYTSLSFKSCESPVSHPYHLNPHLSSFSSNLQFSFKFWRKKHALSFHRAFFQRAKHARGRSNTSKRTLRNETLWKKALWNEREPNFEFRKGAKFRKLKSRDYSYIAIVTWGHSWPKSWLNL